jgi:hypothetical protein
MYLEAPDGHQWVRPAGPPCPTCECCSADLCRLATDRARRCSHYVGNEPNTADVSACPCTTYARDEDARILFPDRFGECFKPDCERLVSIGSQYCCAPCLTAAEHKYEIEHHSRGCELRKLDRHGHPDVIGMTYLLVAKSEPGSSALGEALRTLPKDIGDLVDVRAGHPDGTVVVAVRHTILRTPTAVDAVTDLLRVAPCAQLLGPISGATLDARRERR